MPADDLYIQYLTISLYLIEESYLSFDANIEPIEGRDFRVQVTKKSSRPFSAVDAVAATNENCSSLRKSSRRKSIESSLTRERYKSEQIEKEVKKTASELQMKLNISTSAQLKF